MSAERKPQEPPQKDLIEAARSGDRLETLIALRDMLAERLQNTTSSRDIAAMSRRLMQAISEIEVLEKNREYAKENPFSLSELRRKNNILLRGINQGNKLNSMTSEHEVN